MENDITSPRKIFLEDLVPSMIHIKAWDSWVPDRVWEAVEYDTEIAAACPPGIGWVLWKRKNYEVLYSDQPVIISKENLFYEEPKFCGYIIIDSEASA